MPKFTVTGPDGKNYPIDGPEGATQDDAEKEVYRQHGWDRSNLGAAAKAADPGPFIKGTGEFLGAIPQGLLLGIPEAIYQLGEHTVGLPRPTGTVPDLLRRYRDWAESSTAGTAGETVGNIGAFIGGGELLDLLGLGSKVLPQGVRTWGAMHPGTTTLARTAGESAVAQPVSGDRFWTEKGEQTGLGALLGRILGRTAQQTAHNTATETNKAIELANKSSAEGNKALDESIAERNKRAERADAGAAKSQGQQAADALSTQRDTQIAAKRAVPAATTSEWWTRTLAPLGESVDPNLLRASPEAAATVRNIVGGRLNAITDQMHLDVDDPAFRERANTIRDEASRDLPESDQKGWYHEPPEPEAERLIIDPTTGKKLARTRRGLTDAEPKPPTGDFQKTVLEPLSKGPLSGRDLTNYISSLGDRAEEFARQAQGRPEAERVSLQRRADALREMQDAVIGHASGDPQQKLDLEKARQAYMLWSVGNDAARASNRGVATPKALIDNLTQRLGRGGRGRARYNQALIDPQSPYHDLATWLQGRLGEHTAEVPRAGRVTPAQATPPRTPERRRTPPLDPERPKVPVPKEPLRIGRIPRALGKSAGAAAAYFLGHPFIATGLGTSAAENLIRPGSEGRLEAMLREILENRPRTQRAARAVAGSTAGQADKLRKRAGDIPQAASDALSWVWGSQ